jgi:hypothetical protein
MWELSWICRDHVETQCDLCISMKVLTLKHDVTNVEKSSHLLKHMVVIGNIYQITVYHPAPHSPVP